MLLKKKRRTIFRGTGYRHVQIINILQELITAMYCQAAKDFYYIKYITDVLRLVDDTSRGIPFFIILTSP